jgi:hypothetical protein
MSIDDAIKQLKDRKAQGVKHIVLAYWEADMFDHKDDDKWAGISEIIEADMDWSTAHDQMSQMSDLADV